MSRLRRRDEISGTTIRSILFESDDIEMYRVQIPEQQALRFLLLVDVDSIGRGIETLKQLAFAFPSAAPSAERITEEIVHGRHCLCFLYAQQAADTLENCFLNQAIHFTEETITRLLLNLLEDLRTVHHAGYVFNEILPQDILVDFSDHQLKTSIWNVFHVVHPDEDPLNTSSENRSIFAISNSALENITAPENDLFSIAAIAWRLLYNQYPWETEYQSLRVGNQDSLCGLRENMPRIRLYNKEDGIEISENLTKCLCAALQNEYDSVDAFQNALTKPQLTTHSSASQSLRKPVDQPTPPGGFAEIAGMAELKEKLMLNVIDVLKNSEKARRYRVTIPNGMLLYGPPGCGKSFFAEKFAEETGYNHIMVKASDLGSIYVHGSQEKIAALFKKAEKQAPCIICFEEFDALVPSRDSFEAHQRAGEVNEFLTQMNNCSERGIFIIASTNRKELIDPAVLRTGRIDFSFYVPPPDFDARKAMLRLFVADRPGGDSVNCSELAQKTEGYVASDLRYLIDEAARIAMSEDKELSTEFIQKLIQSIKPSVDLATLESYAQHKDSDGRNDSHHKIGF